MAAAAVAAGGAIVAGSEQAGAAKNATQVEQQQFAQTTANEAPYLAAGGNALNSLETGLGLSGTPGSPGYGALNKPFTLADYQQSPGYQFQLNQGNNQILNTASATGGVKSGNTLKALTQYGQGLADQDFQQGYTNFVNDQSRNFGMLDTVAQSGQNAAANLGGIGANTAAQIGGNITGAGNASAAGIAGATNAASSGINNYLLYQLLNQQNGTGTPPGQTSGPSFDWQ